MTMTKKDYELIAQAILDTKKVSHLQLGVAGVEQESYDYIVAMVAQRIARALRDDNVRFDANRFLAACESFPKNYDGTQLPL